MSTKGLTLSGSLFADAEEAGVWKLHCSLMEKCQFQYLRVIKYKKGSIMFALNYYRGNVQSCY